MKSLRIITRIISIFILFIAFNSFAEDMREYSDYILKNDMNSYADIKTVFPEFDIKDIFHIAKDYSAISDTTTLMKKVQFMVISLDHDQKQTMFNLLLQEYTNHNNHDLYEFLLLMLIDKYRTSIDLLSIQEELKSDFYEICSTRPGEILFYLTPLYFITIPDRRLEYPDVDRIVNILANLRNEPEFSALIIKQLKSLNSLPHEIEAILIDNLYQNNQDILRSSILTLHKDKVFKINSIASSRLLEIADHTDDEKIFGTCSIVLGTLGQEDAWETMIRAGKKFSNAHVMNAINNNIDFIVSLLASRNKKSHELALAATEYITGEDNFDAIYNTYKSNFKYYDKNIQYDFAYQLHKYLSYNRLEDFLDFISGDDSLNPIYMKTRRKIESYDRDHFTELDEPPNIPVDEDNFVRPDRHNSQELSDAGYKTNVLDGANLGWLGHAGLFAGLDVNNDFRIIEVGLIPNVVNHNNWSESMLSDEQYWGAYTIENQDDNYMNFSRRQQVILSAFNLHDNFTIWYPAINPYPNCLDTDPFPGPNIEPDEILALRCDGLVEYCYEVNDIEVWGANQDHYDISVTEYCDEHNNFYDLWGGYDPDTELCPRVQCGMEGGNSTNMTRDAYIQYPTYNIESDINENQVDVTLTATDESGIHYIKYKYGENGTWITSPIQDQIPNSDSYTYDFTLNVQESDWLFYYAKDKGGNFPEHPEGIWIELDDPVFTDYNVSQPHIGEANYVFWTNLMTPQGNPPDNNSVSVNIVGPGYNEDFILSAVGGGNNWINGQRMESVEIPLQIGTYTYSVSGTVNGENINIAEGLPVSRNLIVGAGDANVLPTITITQPVTAITEDDHVIIRFNAFDPDNNARINLYWDDNNQGYDVWPDNRHINTEPIFEDQQNDYLWNTENMPEGSYWIFAIIEDFVGDHELVFSNYSAQVTINHGFQVDYFDIVDQRENEDDGDGDGILEGGESIESYIEIENTSDLTLRFVRGTITSPTPGVIIEDADTYWGELEPGESVWCNDDFNLITTNGFVGEIELVVPIECQDYDGNIYIDANNEYSIYIEPPSDPSFSVGDFTFNDDDDHSNDDGIVQSGENRIDMQVQICNESDVTAFDVEAVLQPIQLFENTNEDEADYGDIPPRACYYPEENDKFYLRRIPKNYSGPVTLTVLVYWGDDFVSDPIEFDMIVQPAPWIRLSHRGETDIGVHDPNETVREEVTIYNDGTFALTIENIETIPENPEDYYEGIDFPLTIGAGEQYTFNAVITRNEPAYVANTYRVISDTHDGENATFSLACTFRPPAGDGYSLLWQSDALDREDHAELIEVDDFDNDGLLDIVLSTGGDLLEFWEQTDQNSFSFEHIQEIVIPHPEEFNLSVWGFSSGNCDGDQYPEIVLRESYYDHWNHHSYIRVYEATGNNSYQQVWISPEMNTNANGACLKVDNFDNDDNCEIVTSSNTNGAIQVYNSNGNNSYSISWTSPNFDDIDADRSFETPCKSDVDNDGNPEIVVVCEDEYIVIYEWNGNGYTLWHRDVLIPGEPSWGDAFPIAGDVDNDGQQEIIIGGNSNGWELTIFDPVAWAIEWHTPNDNNYNEFTIGAISNINGNEYPEILIGDYNVPNLIAFEALNQNEYSEIWNAENTLPGDRSEKLTVHDLNNDDIDEIIIAMNNGFIIYGLSEGLPDLRISEINIAEEEIVENQEIAINIEIQNSGGIDSGPTTCIMTSPGLPDPFIWNIPAIVAGESYSIQTPPPNVFFETEGEYTIGFEIDPDNLVDEENEDNNSRSYDLEIIDDDVVAPEINLIEIAEFEGDGDQHIEAGEQIIFVWTVIDDTPLSENHLLINENQFDAIEIEEGFHVVLEPLEAGIYNYEIHSTDNDNSPLESQISGEFEVISNGPQIVEISPSDEAEEVPLDANVVITFSVEMDERSLNPETIIIVDENNNQIRPIIIEYDPEIYCLTFVPENFRAFRTYTVTVLSADINEVGVFDINDNTLEANFEWSFTTVAVEPTQFNLIHPLNEAVVHDNVIEVEWTAANSVNGGIDPIVYHIDWSLDENFETYQTNITERTSFLIENVNELFMMLQNDDDHKRGKLESNGINSKSDIIKSEWIKLPGNELDELPDDETLFWRIKAVNSHELWTWSQAGETGWSFNIDIYEPPLPFNLISPDINDVIIEPEVMLLWQITSDPDPYDSPVYFEIWLSETDNIEDGNIIARNITENYYEIQGLADDQTYFWTVRAIDSNTPGTWAGTTEEQDIRFFTTNYPDPPSQFLVLTPPNHEVITENFLDVRWEESVDPDEGDIVSYIIHLATDEEFNNEVTFESDNLEFQVEQLQNDHTYWLYVEATDGVHYTRSVNTITFTVNLFESFELELQPRYFELVSTYLEPVNRDAIEVFGGILNLMIVYQNDGEIYVPPAFNTIGDINLSQGYRIFCDEATSLTIEGSRIDPDQIYSIIGNSWNWIGYPFNYEVSMSDALAHIAENIVIIMNDEGNLWIPQILNSLGNGTPGEGYLVFSNMTFDFQYHEIGLARIKNENIIDIPGNEDGPSPTGLPFAVLTSFTDELLAYNPNMIELYDGLKLVGKAPVLKDSYFTPVIAWQEHSNYSLVGFKPGNNINIVVKNSNREKIPVTIKSDSNPVYGVGAYASLNLDIFEIPEKFAVEHGYPNPFNPTVTVPYALPFEGEVSFVLFNVLGQQVYSSIKHCEAGYHNFVFGTNNTDTELVSGMYFLRVDFNGSSSIQKLMLLK